MNQQEMKMRTKEYRETNLKTMSEHLPNSHEARRIGDQLFRSGTFQLGAIIVQLVEHVQKWILSQNWELFWKKRMNLFIGWKLLSNAKSLMSLY